MSKMNPGSESRSESTSAGRMDPHVKAEWTAALRSGEYKQGRLSLKNEYLTEATHCCLGVLTDLAAKAGVVQWGRQAWPADARLCAEVREWAGLDSANPILSDDFLVTNSASNLNDEGSTFIEIADRIDQWL